MERLGSIRGVASLSPSSPRREAHPGVDRRVEQVDHEVDDHEDEHGQHQVSDDDRAVEAVVLCRSAGLPRVSG